MSALPEEAAEWLMRLEEDDSAACRAEFYRWFAQSPRHVQEFLQATETAAALQGLDRQRHIDVDALISAAASNVVALGDAVREPKSVRKPLRRKFWGLAAAVAVLTIGAAIFFVPSTMSSPSYTTGVGEQRTLKLPDGSMLVLNTRSQVRVELSARRRDVWLMDGEALFTVARDPARPFRVLTSDATVQALGTQFDVHRYASGTKVAVIEGSVQVSAPHASTRKLSAGEEARVGNEGELETRPLPNPAAALAWRERRLEFHDAGLSEVAAEFNRYNTRQMRIEGELGVDKRITGIFNADNPDALASFLRRDRSLEVENEGKNLVIRPSP